MNERKIVENTPSEGFTYLQNMYEKQLVLNETFQSDLKEHAQACVNRYFDWWKPKQHLKIATGDKKNAGIVHPMVRVRKNTGKVYIPWVSHKYKNFKRINPKWSTEIPFGSTGYTASKLRNNSQYWELEKIIEIEAELAFYRKALHKLHEEKVQTLKAIKKLDKAMLEKSNLTLEKKNEL